MSYSNSYRRLSLEKEKRQNLSKLTQSKCVQKCFCLVKIACYHAKSTGGKKKVSTYQKAVY